MIEPRLAPVRPRVFLRDAQGTAPIEDEILERLAAGRYGAIELTGCPGAGKRTAIAHLAYRFFGDDRLVLADHPSADASRKLLDAAPRKLVVSAGPFWAFDKLIDQWRIAPWTKYECIEYVLAMHREQCASVMRRLGSTREYHWLLCGVPRLLRLVLDRLATDESSTDAKTALRLELHSRLTTAETRIAALDYCLAMQHAWFQPSAVKQHRSWLDKIEPELSDLLQYGGVQLILAADHLAEQLSSGKRLELLEGRMPESLVRETAALVRDNPEALSQLRNVLTLPYRRSHPMAASILHAAGMQRSFGEGRAPLLAGAYLAGARWSGVRLKRVNMNRADLTGADLSETQLEGVSMDGTNLTGARLHGAKLEILSAAQACLAGSDLSFVRAAQANFTATDLCEANLEVVLLAEAVLVRANLTGARFQRADLSGADLSSCSLDEADFTAANLSGANLAGSSLRTANFAGALFNCANLNDCDLEDMRLPGAQFEYARLSGAHLTGSQMPGAHFRGATLRGTWLAEIDWEGADLRDADLSNSTFHLGSSRSGLLDSPIACEGSRTGFYTDEFHEQEFKSPEEIRKANLCRADLRGAKVDNVDFYLVDLRGALYTPEHEDHFRKCKAILEARV